MKQVNVHQAKTQLSKLIEQALRGEEVVIARRDQPVVRLQPIRSRLEAGKSAFGSMKGLVEFMAPDFDEPLEDLKDYMETAEEMAIRTKKAKARGR